MLPAIVRNDWRNLAADRTVLAVAGLLALTILYGVFNGARWASKQGELRQSLVDEENSRLDKLRVDLEEIASTGKEPSRFRDPRSPGNVGQRFAPRYAVMPGEPLAAFAVGQSDLLPSHYQVTLDSREVLFAGEEVENPVNLAAGRFDLAFVIVFLYPLVILALSYNLISSEKEQGTLSLALAQPVSLARLVTGKILLRAALLFSLTALFTIGAALIAGVDLGQQGALFDLFLWFAVTVAYGLFWFALAVGVNALGGSSATNAMILSALWLIFVLIVPSGLNLAASALYPVPSRVEMIQAIRSASQEASRRGSQVLGRYYEDHPELLPAGEVNLTDFTAQRYAVQEEVEALIAPVSERFEQQIDGQQRVVDHLRFVSPAILTQQALNDIAGTGYARYRHFLDQVSNFAARWKEHFYPRIFRGARFTPDEISLLPRFVFRAEPSGQLLGRVSGQVATVGAITLALIALALIALRRFPVAP